MPYGTIPTGDLRGHGHFPVLHFFHAHPDFSHYWLIEYDVRYTGDWGILLAGLNDPGVAYYGVAMQRRASNPKWSHWQSLCTGRDDVAEAHFVKSFTPLQRRSRPAISVIQTALRNGWSGHYEALWPTAIAHARLRLEAIEEHQISQWPPTLWHPVLRPAGMQKPRIPEPARPAGLARRILRRVPARLTSR